jgi:2-polyprenyl-3-methyl-5-hydroxy-6-metoxy-1,4-benzoquinol methylase
MKSPVQWLRWRLSNFVYVRIRSAIEAENLSVLRDDLSVLREDILLQSNMQAELRTDLQTFRREVSEDQRIPALEAIMPEVISRLDNIDGLAQGANALTREVVSRVDNIDGLAQAANSVARDVGVRLDAHSAELSQLSSRIRANPFQNSLSNIVSARDGSSTMGFAGAGSGQYVDFVEAFRPTFDALLDQLSHLKTWLPVSGTAVDLGAGRGEMVQVMSDQGLSSFGIDADESVVAAAGQKGIDVRLSDIDSFLDKCLPSSLDVVTAIQVVEHVNTDQLESWLGKIHRSLKPGGVFIAETPNPHAIDAFKAFWVDVTHVRPYYPESLLHMAQSAGFSRAEIWAPGEQDNITDRLEFAGSYTLIATA